MILIEAQQVAQSSPSWWNIVAVVGVALIGWLVVHRTSKNRDFENWRRTQLTNAVIDFIKHINAFENLVIKYMHPVNEDQNPQELLLEMAEQMDNAASDRMILKICDSTAVLAQVNVNISKMHVIFKNLPSPPIGKLSDTDKTGVTDP